MKVKREKNDNPIMEFLTIIGEAIMWVLLLGD